MGEPGCAIILGRGQEESSYYREAPCQIYQMLQWVLTPGLWEETFKAGWLMWRVKTKPWWGREHNYEDPANLGIPKMTCCIFPTMVCTFWWRLLETPEAVFLCALAAG